MNCVARWMAGWGVVGLAGLASAAGESWPMFRGGPGLTGVAAGSLPDALELRWTFKAAQPVKSSAALADGRVYVGADDGKIYALAADTGKELWSFKTQDTIEASPLALEGTVYVGSSDGFLYALEAATGKLKWKYQTGDKILGAANWFRAGAPPALRIVVGSYDFKVHCVDAATGQAVWTFETANYVNGTPAVADGRIVFGGCDAMLHVLDAVKGTELGAVEAGAYMAGSAAISGARAYGGQYGEEVLCVDLAAMKNVWTCRQPDSPFFSSPAVTDTRVVIGGRDKQLHCLDRATGKVLWLFPTQGDVDSSPVVCGDKVVVGSQDGRLYMVALATGKQVWSYEIGKPLTASPSVAGGLVVIGSEDGAVYAFGPPKAK